MKPKILITGSCGFILSNFVRKAIYENRDIVSIDKVSHSSLLNNIYINKSHKFYLADITDPHIINTIFDYERPDIIVHGAACTHVDDSLKSPGEFIKNNVLGTQILIDASVKFEVKKFIFCSTDECYGQLENDRDLPWKEEAPLNPRNPYAASKASAEMFVKAAGNSFGLNYCITRSSNNYGPRQTPDKLIPKIIKCVVEKTNIPIYGQGLQMRDWLHVFDNCAGIMKVIDEGKFGEIYNISANQEFTNIEIAQLICNVMNEGHNLITHIEDPRRGHDYRYATDSSKLKGMGWEPQWKFKNGIKQTVEWYLNNRYFLKQ